MKTLFCCLLACSLSCAEAKEAVFAHSVKFISHQGERFDAPSHSRPAYKLAMERKADLMKLDIHYTKDAVPVLSHDPTLKRTMDWDVKIKDKTLHELKTQGTFLPVGGYGNEKIMTLKEGLEIVRNCPEFWIDPKTFPKAPEFGWQKGSCLEVVLEEFRKAGISRERIILATFGDNPLMYARKNLPDLRRIKHIQLKKMQGGGIVGNFFPGELRAKENIVELLVKEKERLGLWGVNLPRSAFSQELLDGKDIQRLRAAGLRCAVWFVNDPVDATFFSLYGADAFVTDKINSVRPYCRTGDRMDGGNR